MPRFCENGFYDVFGVVELPSQSRRDHVHGFGEADVANFLLGDEILKFFNGEASTYFLLEGETARRGVLDAFYAMDCTV